MSTRDDEQADCDEFWFGLGVLRSARPVGRGPEGLADRVGAGQAARSIPTLQKPDIRILLRRSAGKFDLSSDS